MDPKYNPGSAEYAQKRLQEELMGKASWREKFHDACRGLIRLVKFATIIGMIVFGLYAVWTWIQDEWIGRDRLTTVYSNGWATGEYKDCNSLSAITDNPSIRCDAADSDGKIFKVKFHGPIHIKDQSAIAAIIWQCRKNAEDDPAISCERKPDTAGH